MYLSSCPGDAALGVEQHIVDRVAEPPVTLGRKSVLLSLRRVGIAERETDGPGAFHGRGRGGALDADHPGRRELVVAADLAADHGAGWLTD